MADDLLIVDPHEDPTVIPITIARRRWVALLALILTLADGITDSSAKGCRTKDFPAVLAFEFRTLVEALAAFLIGISHGLLFLLARDTWALRIGIGTRRRAGRLIGHLIARRAALLLVGLLTGLPLLAGLPLLSGLIAAIGLTAVRLFGAVEHRCTVFDRENGLLARLCSARILGDFLGAFDLLGCGCRLRRLGRTSVAGLLVCALAGLLVCRPLAGRSLTGLILAGLTLARHDLAGLRLLRLGLSCLGRLLLRLLGLLGITLLRRLSVRRLFGILLMLLGGLLGLVRLDGTVCRLVGFTLIGLLMLWFGCRLLRLFRLLGVRFLWWLSVGRLLGILLMLLDRLLGLVRLDGTVCRLVGFALIGLLMLWLGCRLLGLLSLLGITLLWRRGVRSLLGILLALLGCLLLGLFSLLGVVFLRRLGIRGLLDILLALFGCLLLRLFGLQLGCLLLLGRLIGLLLAALGLVVSVSLACLLFAPLRPLTLLVAAIVVLRALFALTLLAGLAILRDDLLLDADNARCERSGRCDIKP
jgi:hypothetical protein